MALFRRAVHTGVCFHNLDSGLSLCKQQKYFLRLGYNEKTYHHNSVLHYRHGNLMQLGLKHMSTSEGKLRACLSFDTMMQQRREQAQRSVLVQVHSGLSYQDLKAHCSQFGLVEKIFYYTTREDMHFMLVEFATEKHVKKLMETVSFGSRLPAVPVASPFLWLRATENKKTRKELTAPEKVEDSEATPQHLHKLLQEADSVSHQIALLYSSTQLGELGTRLRFLTARQLEMSLSGMFPRIRAVPFGSSVNGFGRAGCDLDLVMQLGGAEEGQEEEDAQEKRRLVFHSKGSAAFNGRAQLQRHMETIADIIHHFLPGCSRVIRILQARVPIIKFRHDLTMLECDLSMTNMTAVHMSEFLYLMGEVDDRVRPLVFSVRRWAQAVGLTNPTPGRWVSNFTLTLLTLFYLQNRKVPVLPSLGTLAQLAGPDDHRITADGINCTFLRNLSNLALSKNNESLEDLLRGFFEFYSTFDFGGKGISLVAGKSIPKPDHASLYIENPLERSLNVSKNVSPEEILRLRVELRNSAWFFEQLDDEEAKERDDENAWGLLSLLSAPHTPGLSPPRAKNYRLVQVKDLFSNKELNEQNKSHQSKNYNVKPVRQRRR